MDTRYVQHISGQGKKWEVWGDAEGSWITRAQAPLPETRWFLPKSEYVRCDPPEEWVDVTASFEVDRDGFVVSSSLETVRIEIYGHNFSKYRLRKVQLWQPGEGGKGNCRVWAFRIEKKEPA